MSALGQKQTFGNVRHESALPPKADMADRNVRTARGGKWTHVQVGAVLRPFEAGAAGL
jgi:hypothetical protein